MYSTLFPFFFFRYHYAEDKQWNKGLSTPVDGELAWPARLKEGMWHTAYEDIVDKDMTLPPIPDKEFTFGGHKVQFKGHKGGKVTKAQLDTVLADEHQKEKASRVCVYPSYYFSEDWTDKVKAAVDAGTDVDTIKDTCGIKAERIPYCIWDEESLKMTRPPKSTMSKRPEHIKGNSAKNTARFLTSAQFAAFGDWLDQRPDKSTLIADAFALAKTAATEVTSLYEGLANEHMENSLWDTFYNVPGGRALVDQACPFVRHVLGRKKETVKEYRSARNLRADSLALEALGGAPGDAGSTINALPHAGDGGALSCLYELVDNMPANVAAKAAAALKKKGGSAEDKAIHDGALALMQGILLSSVRFYTGPNGGDTLLNPGYGSGIVPPQTAAEKAAALKKALKKAGFGRDKAHLKKSVRAQKRLTSLLNAALQSPLLDKPAAPATLWHGCLPSVVDSFLEKKKGVQFPGFMSTTDVFEAGVGWALMKENVLQVTLSDAASDKALGSNLHDVTLAPAEKEVLLPSGVVYDVADPVCYLHDLANNEAVTKKRLDRMFGTKRATVENMNDVIVWMKTHKKVKWNTKGRRKMYVKKI